jgi:hypothetical protein
MNEATAAIEEKQPVVLREPRTETELRGQTFAEQVLLTVEIGTAYRNVFAPGQDVTPYHRSAGARLLKDEYVGLWIKELATHALESASVDRAHAIKRLLETIDSDITDFVHEGRDEFMSLKEIRDKLPLEKRRLIRKYTERLNKDGYVVSRTIELEPKQPAIDLLARIQRWVSPDQINVVKGDMIVNVISQAQNAAIRRVEALRPVIEGSKTVKMISRSAIASNLLTGPAKEPEGAPEPDAPA